MITEDFKRNFLQDTDHTGRHIVRSLRTGREYYIECIDSGQRTTWGDQDPVSGKLTGKYGTKYRGCIDAKDSMIDEANGFKNVKTLAPGQSPYAYIEELDSQYPDKE